MHRGLWNMDHASFFSEATLIEIGVYFLPEYFHIGRVFWIMSRRRLLDHILRLLEYCTFFVTSLAFSSLDKKNLVISVPYKKERWKPTKLCLRNECVCGSHSGILENIETKERVKDKSSTPTGLVWYINMAVVSWARVTIFVFRRREGRVFNRWGKGRPSIKNSPSPLSPPRPHQKK